MKAPAPDQILRRCRFQPYRKGMGPTFALTIWDTYQPSHHAGRTRIGYRLTMKQPGKKPITLFVGEDITLSAGCAYESNEAVAEVMGWLTLRRGDTDAEFFANDTKIQAAYRATYAESLAWYVEGRFGEVS